MPDAKIDAVITWVNDADPKWLAKKSRYQQQANHSLNGVARYRDFDTLKYVLRSLDAFAPWMHKIFLVTDQQVPSWLVAQHSKLQVMDHQDYIPQRFLPTFNSNVIEMNLYRISELSENFILFNDDTLLTRPVKPSDFFVQGLPKDTAALSPICPELDGIESLMANNIKLVNSQFTQKAVVKRFWSKFFNWRNGPYNLRTLFLLPYTKFSGFMDFHIPLALKKSVFSDLATQFSEQFLQTSQHRFRSNEDITIWLVRYWQLCTGQFQPRSYRFGKYIPLTDLAAIQKTLADPRCKAICVNDVPMTKAQLLAVQNNLAKILEQRLPHKSSFEK